jgi:hypothetical protein
MGKILTSDVVQECFDITAEDPPGGTCGLSAEWVGKLCDSHEALRDLLREVLIEWRNGRACGCERCKDLIARASDAVDAAVEVGR